MRTSLSLLLLLMAACVTEQPFDQSARARVEQEVTQAQRAFLESISGPGSLETILAAWETDGLYVEDGVPHASRAAWEESYTSIWNVERMELDDYEVLVSAMDANNAVSFVEARVRQFDRQGELIADGVNRLMSTWTRRNGDWRLHSYWQGPATP